MGCILVSIAVLLIIWQVFTWSPMIAIIVLLLIVGLYSLDMENY